MLDYSTCLARRLGFFQFNANRVVGEKVGEAFGKCDCGRWGEILANEVWRVFGKGSERERWKNVDWGSQLFGGRKKLVCGSFVNECGRIVVVEF